jgi:hypothetical protein
MLKMSRREGQVRWQTARVFSLREVRRANDCSSANDQFAKGKERSYVAALESRVERLEKILAQNRSRKPSVTMLDAQMSLAVNFSKWHDIPCQPARQRTSLTEKGGIRCGRLGGRFWLSVRYIGRIIIDYS